MFFSFLIAMLLGYCSPKIYSRVTETDIEKCARVNSKLVDRYFYNNNRSYGFGSIFKYKKSYFTAAHVIEDTAYIKQGHNKIHYSFPMKAVDESKWVVRPNGMDFAVYNKRDASKYKLTEPKEGQQIVALGYPAGTGSIRVEYAFVYSERGSGSNNWISVGDNSLNKYNIPIVGGMSGGLVLGMIDKGTCLPVGVIVSTGGDFDYNADGIKEWSFDFVGLKGAI